VGEAFYGGCSSFGGIVTVLGIIWSIKQKANP
jgi:hypothetical protein